MYLTLRTKPMDKGRTIKALFHKLDTDNDGHLGFRYFIVACQTRNLQIHITTDIVNV